MARRPHRRKWRAPADAGKGGARTGTRGAGETGGRVGSSGAVVGGMGASSFIIRDHSHGQFLVYRSSAERRAQDRDDRCRDPRRRGRTASPPAADRRQSRRGVEGAPEARRRQDQDAGHRDLHAPVLDHDQLGLAAGAGARHPRQAEREQDPAGSDAGSRLRRRVRAHGRRCAAQASQGVQRPVREHGRGRRGRWYSRHDPDAARRLHGKERRPDPQGEGRDDLSRRHHVGGRRSRSPSC